MGLGRCRAHFPRELKSGHWGKAKGDVLEGRVHQSDSGFAECGSALLVVPQTDSVERRSTRILNTGHFVHKCSVNMHFHRLNVQFANDGSGKWGMPET